MKALVTGAAGHIGSTIVDHLVERGFDVVGIDDMSAGNWQSINKRSTFCELSILEIDKLKSLSADVDHFYHCAVNLPHVKPPYEDIVRHEQVNVVGTLHCIEAAQTSKRLKKFIFASTCAVYGEADVLPTPETAEPKLLTRPYTIHKYACEQHLQLHSRRFEFPSIILRFFATYGKRSFNPTRPDNAYTSAVAIFSRQLKQKEPISVTGDGTQSRDLIHVDDVARISVDCALSDKRNADIYNVSSGQSYRIIDIAKKFSDDIVYIGRHMGEVEKVWGCIDKIENEIGVKPHISIDEGIARMIEETTIK